MKTKLFGTDARHETFKQDIIKVIKKHASRLPKEDQLAVASQIIGVMVALQDSRVMTSEMVMTIVAQNIQRGNDEIIANLKNTKGSA